MGDPNYEHKKTTFPYVEPTVQLPDEIEENQKRIDDDFSTTNNTLNKINIQALSNNILRNLRLMDNRTTQKFMDDYFISIDDRTQREREEDDNISLESEDEKVTIEDVLELDNIDNR